MSPLFAFVEMGNKVWAFFIIYAIFLVFIGWLGKRASTGSGSMSDFYLNARSMSLWVLLPTLYATQYSGNTLIGFAAKAYRSGFTLLYCVTFMMGVIGIYLIYAPKLYSLSRINKFITTGDFVHWRFKNRMLTTLVAISGIVAMANFIISNLKAIGVMTETATNGQTPAWIGICFFALIILIYEMLGGLRSVAWTDVIQGVILFLGCIVIFFTVIVDSGGITGVIENVKTAAPQYWQPPTGSDLVGWWSTIIVISIGIALYPHAIQRIYAARSAKSLKIAFQAMVYLPLFTTLLMISVGWIGRTRFPELSKEASEGITLEFLTALAVQIPSVQIVILLFMAAVFSAIMSTVDSALLSISSMITQDLYRPVNSKMPEKKLTRLGKFASFLVMLIVVVITIFLESSIYQIIEIKLELLVQIAPAVILGLHWKSLRSEPILAGLVVGLVVSLFFVLGSMYAKDLIPRKPMNLHAGLIGFFANVFVILILHSILGPLKEIGKDRVGLRN